MYIRRKVFSVGIDENGEERLFSVNEVISEEAYLGQREFNSKAQKARRRRNDYKIGNKRLRDAGDAEFAFFDGAARYPGEIINEVYREGPNWHYKAENRPGVSVEKAEELARLAAEKRKKDPKWTSFTRDMIAGRDKQKSVTGYSSDLTNLNQRINARGLGDITLKDEFEAAKKKAAEEAAKEGNKVLGWVKKNPGKTAVGVLGTAGLAYGGKKAYDHYKKNKDKDK